MRATTMLKGLALAALVAVTLPVQGKTVKYYQWMRWGACVW